MAELESALPPVGDGLPAEPRPTNRDDFFCRRFQLWYPSRDCAIRTKYRTCPACRDCDQGRFNARRHAEELSAYRFPIPLGE